jgi:hypothetical protein
MAAVATNRAPRAPREVVDFPPNVPVSVALKYGQGRTISNQHGERVMYSLTDGRVMFLDLDVARKIESAGINVRESFTITRNTDSKTGSLIAWEVARVPGEQPNGTFVVRAADTPTSKLPVSSSAASDSGAGQCKLARSPLVDEANVLVDCFAQVLERSLRLYQGRVKPDEIKTLVVTACIQRQKLSSVA